MRTFSYSLDNASVGISSLGFFAAELCTREGDASLFSDMFTRREDELNDDLAKQRHRCTCEEAMVDRPLRG